jgi:hypothetical protein
MRRGKLLLFAPLAILACVGMLAVGGAIVQALWNWLLPAIFGWRQVTFWQALGMLALCRILFGGFGRHGSHRHGGDGGGAGGRWPRMTPEEKERFRQRMRERWGFAPPADGSAPESAPRE